MKAKIKEVLKRVNNLLIAFSNYILCSLAYGFGVSFSFLLWKLATPKKRKEITYWIVPKEEEENYERQL